MQVGVYEQQQRDRARALKAKFYPTTQKAVQRPVMEVPAFLHLVPSWKREPTWFDAHMIAWRKDLDERLNPVKAYISRRAPQLGFTVSDIMKGGGRASKVSHARFLIMWEVKNYVNPSMSFPELGRAFGGFDHTSCLYAVKKIDKLKAEDLVAEVIDDI
jgi:DnaA-like protein